MTVACCSHNSLLVLDEEVLKDIRGVQELRCASCGLASLRVLTLHNNLLVSLELQLQSHAVAMHLVTIHDNRWQCSSEADCTWITRTVDTLNKSAVKYLNQVNGRGRDLFKIHYLSLTAATR